MNDFMNAIWNAEGAYITGTYKGLGFIGQITNTRMKYGGEIAVTITVDLEESDLDRATLVVDGSVLQSGESGVFENLHVYF